MDPALMDACPLIELFGPPHERGQQYGRQAAVRIKRGIAHYGTQLAKLDLGRDALRGLIRDYLPVIERFDASYVEEMQGIARGAEVEFEQVVLLNARTELLKLAERPDLRRRLTAAEEPDGCTGVVALPPATRERNVIHAQNWDWKPRRPWCCAFAATTGPTS
jgi:isopenicillin-N N-acyltransferase-like protein